MKPEFATNRDGERVADAIAAYLDQLIAAWREPFRPRHLHRVLQPRRLRAAR